jgi:excisionase family DNA binding protein
MEGKESQVAKTLTVETAAKELGISRSSAYEAAHRGEIPAIVIGRRVLVLRRGLDEMLEGKLVRHCVGQERSSPPTEQRARQRKATGRG